MRTPDSPYLELGFYFESLAQREVLLRVIDTLTLWGGVSCHSATSSIPGPKENETDAKEQRQCKEREYAISDLNEVRALMTNDDQVLRKLTISGLMNIIPDTYEFVVSGDRVGRPSQHGTVIGIWGDGSWLSTGSTEVDAFQKKCGPRVLEVFRTLIGEMSPTYAAITVDYGLETPDELRRDPRSYAFRNFYLSARLLSQSVIRRFGNEYQKFHQETCGEGRLFLSAGFLLPDDPPVPSAVAYEASGFIANTIAHALP